MLRLLLVSNFYRQYCDLVTPFVTKAVCRETQVVIEKSQAIEAIALQLLKKRRIAIALTKQGRFQAAEMEAPLPPQSTFTPAKSRKAVVHRLESRAAQPGAGRRATPAPRLPSPPAAPPPPGS